LASNRKSAHYTGRSPLPFVGMAKNVFGEIGKGQRQIAQIHHSRMSRLGQ